MKRFILIIVVLILLTLGCSQPFDTGQGESESADSQNDQPPASSSEKRCGDGVCDGPETAKNCATDCAVQVRDDEEPAESPAKDVAIEDLFLGQIFVEMQVQRQDGVGTCGLPPWGVDHIEGGDFTCPPPKYWYGYDLDATALQIVQITPGGGNSWHITGSKPGGGTYQKVAHWSDGERVCSPVSIDGEVFDFDVDGIYQNGQIDLTFSALPTEVSNWSCDGGNSYQRETTLLLIDWSIAMTGDYTNLSATLTDEDALAAGIYLHEYVADVNPSPENRDHVNATIEFRCIESTGEGVYSSVACPWE